MSLFIIIDKYSHSKILVVVISLKNPLPWPVPRRSASRSSLFSNRTVSRNFSRGIPRKRLRGFLTWVPVWRGISITGQNVGLSLNRSFFNSTIISENLPSASTKMSKKPYQTSTTQLIKHLPALEKCPGQVKAALPFSTFQRQ